MAICPRPSSDAIWTRENWITSAACRHADEFALDLTGEIRAPQLFKKCVVHVNGETPRILRVVLLESHDAICVDEHPPGDSS